MFTPRSHSHLPGLALDGDPDGYASRDEFAAYLERYAAHFRLAVATSVRVDRLVRSDGDGFTASLSTGESLSASNVVIAAGGFQIPMKGNLEGNGDPKVFQLGLDGYHAPSDLPSGPVLVVGDGASGRDIAAELAASHEVILATGRRRRLIPERMLGRSIWWWMDRLGLLRASAASPIGRLMRQRDPFPDRDRSLSALRRRGIQIWARALRLDGREVVFSDGAKARVDSILWATGYRDDTSWIDMPEAIDTTGGYAHSAGVSPVPGLYFVGRPWQRNRASGLVMGVADDAKVIAERITGGRDFQA